MLTIVSCKTVTPETTGQYIHAKEILSIYLNRFPTTISCEVVDRLDIAIQSIDESEDLRFSFIARTEYLRLLPS